MTETPESAPDEVFQQPATPPEPDPDATPFETPNFEEIQRIEKPGVEKRSSDD